MKFCKVLMILTACVVVALSENDVGTAVEMTKKPFDNDIGESFDQNDESVVLPIDNSFLPPIDVESAPLTNTIKKRLLLQLSDETFGDILDSYGKNNSRQHDEGTSVKSEKKLAKSTTEYPLPIDNSFYPPIDEKSAPLGDVHKRYLGLVSNESFADVHLPPYDENAKIISRLPSAESESEESHEENEDANMSNHITNVERKKKIPKRNIDKISK